MPQAAGHLAVVLHAHLPFVRHPEHPRFLEESWFFEAVVEVYLPLIQLCEGWVRDRVPARITLSLSTTLCAMLSDSLLLKRTGTYIASRIELLELEHRRTTWTPDLRSVVEVQHRQWLNTQTQFDRYQSRFLKVFQTFEQAGILELICCSATHAILPFITPNTGCIEAQIRTAVRHHQHYFGRPPRGFWLPECAYHPSLDAMLRDAGIEWIILDRHGRVPDEFPLSNAAEQPIQTDSGLVVFFRDMLSANQVWSRESGYPGNPVYRDFHADLGFEAEMDYIEPFLPCPQQRGFTGLKYYQVSGPRQPKALYNPETARRQAELDAAHFIRSRQAHLRLVSKKATATAPILVCPYDAELFGHWWHEGPQFLDQLVRQLTKCLEGPRLQTPSDHLDILRSANGLQSGEALTSTWGEGGYYDVWLNPQNAWLFPKLRQAESLLAAHLNSNPNALRRSQLLQAASELLLAQASDWPFLIRPGTDNPYAQERLVQHLNQFHACLLPSSHQQPLPPSPFPLLQLQDWGKNNC